MKVKELLSDPFKWTQRAYARDKIGRKTGPTSQDATCFCLKGAVYHCYPFDYDSIFSVLRNELEKRYNNASIVDFNDGVPYEKVRDLVNELDI